MEGEPDGQNQGEVLNGIIPVEKTRNLAKIGVKEIEIFKDEKDGAGGDNADDQVPFSLLSLRLLDEKGRRVIDGNGQGQDQNIDRYKGHIKDTTGRQKEKPSVGMRNQKIESRYRGEKDEE
jgi:hypothetical protein